MVAESIYKVVEQMHQNRFREEGECSSMQNMKPTARVPRLESS